MYRGTTWSPKRLRHMQPRTRPAENTNSGVVLGYQKSEELKGGGICPDGGVVVGGRGGMGREDTASVTSIGGVGSDTQPIETGGTLCEVRIGVDRLSICEI